MRFVFWLAVCSWLTLAQAGVSHSCPAQGNGVGAAAGEHADHSGHDASGAPRECSCVGDCFSSSVAALSDAPEMPATSIAPQVVLPPATEQQFVRRDAHHRLPYGNGPPSLPSRTQLS
jgi:hypothetical protein